MREHVISSAEEGQRLDKFLRRCLFNAPPSFIYRMLRKKNITLNGRKSDGSERIAAGDIVRLFLSDETIEKFSRDGSGAGSGAPSDAEMSRLARNVGILYRDDDILAVSKPGDMLTQKDSPSSVSLTEVVRFMTESCAAGGAATFLPSPAHRLDRNTSGIVLFGCSVPGQQFLSSLIRGRDLKKEYLAIVSGTAAEAGEYRAYYRKDAFRNRVILSDSPDGSEGEMVTGLVPVSSGGGYSLLLVDLITGKPHQIRAHLAHLGMPVAGDMKYGREDINRRLRRECGMSRQMLHALRVTFPHSEGRFTGVSDRSIMADIPPDMRNAMRFLSLEGDIHA